MVYEVKESKESLNGIGMRVGICSHCGQPVTYWLNRYTCHFCHAEVLWKNGGQDDEKKQ